MNIKALANFYSYLIKRISRGIKVIKRSAENLVK